MAKIDSVSYDEWIDYCFLHGYSAFQGREEDDPRFFAMDENLVADYLIQFFEKPGIAATRFSPDQLSDGTWFIFGIASDYFHNLCHPSVSRDRQIRCIRGIRTLYGKLYDKTCNAAGARPDDDMTNTDQLDIAVSMIWDMDGLAAAAKCPGCEYLVDPTFEVLQSTLTLDTSTCIKSGLHGLNRMAYDHPERVHRIIDDFLSRRQDLPEWLIHYAESAREGMNQ